MKTISTILLISIFLFSTSCKDHKNDTTTVITGASENSSTKKAAEKISKNVMLKQQGSYTSLFNRERGDCGFITSEILARSLNVNSNNITPGDNDCTYFFKEENGKSTRFYFTVEPWDNKHVIKEIKSALKNAEMFGKDSKLSQYRISETGDTYLSMHQNRMIRILNEASQNVIILFYTPQTAPDETDFKMKDVLKDEAREHAYTISNYLLKTNQLK